MAVEILDPELPDDYGDDIEVDRESSGRYFSSNCWAQWRFLQSEVPDLLYSGHLGSSKTRSLCEKADRRCRRFGDARVVVGRRYREHLGKTTIPMFREKVLTPSHWAWGYRKSDDGGSALYYPNGSQIWFVGFDNPQRLLSAEVDMILIEQCEEVSEEMWDSAAGRLRRSCYDEDDVECYWQIGGVCNPGSPEHFLWKRFRPDMGSHITWTTEATRLLDGRTVPAGQAVREVIMASVTDNVENLSPAYLARIQRYRGRYYERMVLGKWIAFEGMVYDIFDRDVHVIPRPLAWREWGGYPPPSWPRVRSVDFGYYPDPFVFQWWAISPLGEWFLYREIYRTRMLVAEHCEKIAALEAAELATLKAFAEKNKHEPPRTLPVAATWGDHDAEDRATMQKAGIPVAPAIKEISPGLQTCYEMLTPVVAPGGVVPRPKVYFVQDALAEVDVEREDAHLPVRTADEFYAYKYRDQPDDPSKPSKQGPNDQHNHGMDAMRYAIHTYRIKRRNREPLWARG